MSAGVRSAYLRLDVSFFPHRRHCRRNCFRPLDVSRITSPDRACEHANSRSMVALIDSQVAMIDLVAGQSARSRDDIETMNFRGSPTSNETTAFRWRP